MGQCNCGNKGVQKKKDTVNVEEESSSLDNMHYLLIAGIILLLILIKTKC